MTTTTDTTPAHLLPALDRYGAELMLHVATDGPRGYGTACGCGWTPRPTASRPRASVGQHISAAHKRASKVCDQEMAEAREAARVEHDQARSATPPAPFHRWAANEDPNAPSRYRMSDGTPDHCLTCGVVRYPLMTWAQELAAGACRGPQDYLRRERWEQYLEALGNPELATVHGFDAYLREHPVEQSA